MAELSLNGMEFNVPLGFYKEERLAGTNIEVDVVLTINAKDGFVDSIDETINYEDIYSIVSGIVNKEYKLIEALATDLLLAICEPIAKDVGVIVRLRKLRPPLKGVVNYAQIVVERD